MLVVESNPKQFFALYQKNSSNDPYMKLLDFSQLLAADAPMIVFVAPKYSLHPLKADMGLQVHK